MAQRITEAELRALVDIESAFDPTTFINTAVALTDTLPSSLGATLAKQVELYLAAHFYSIYDRVAQSERVDDLQVTYYGQGTIGLKFTPYGQQALLLDSTGTLSRLDKGKKTPDLWHIG